MKKFLLASIVLVCLLHANAQTGIPVPQMTGADTRIKNFMTTYAIPTLTFAMAKNGKIVYMRAFGYADKANTVLAQPYNLFRIASCSKQITSIAIMKLMQEGKLNMSDKVFGTGGLLEHHPSYATATITDNRIYNITVRQLLEHSAGWDRTVNCNPNPTTPYSWFIGGCDPIDGPLRVTQQLGTSNPATENDLIKYLLQLGLNFDPGTKYAYSNIGYLVLGAIIEQLSEMSYEEYIQTTILHPLGIFDMHIGKNLLSEKMEREVEYVGGEGNNLSVYGDGRSLPWEYGGMNVNAMDAHGGWVCTARDMITLLNAVDGFATKPDILSKAAVDTMVKPSATSPNYAKGWQVNASNNWWHTGAIPGTASEQVRASNGYTWTVIMNHRNNTNNFWSALDNLGWNIISGTTSWPTYDLMLAPTQNASGITFSNVTSNSITVNWTNGNGGNRIVVVRPDSAINAFPLDGTDYTDNANYPSATSLGTNNRIVYKGTGNSVTVTGLTPGTTYHFRVIEYNKTTETGNNALYLLGNNARSSTTTFTTLPVKLVSFTANKTNDQVTIDWTTAQEINTSHFEVQRSVNGTDFSTTTNKNAKGSGNTSTAYSCIDDLTNVALLGSTIYYRLKMVDKDGSFEYSPVKSISFSQQNRYTISPNPAKNIVNITGRNIVKVELFNTAGKVLLSRDFTTHLTVSLDISALSAGVYVMVITDHEGARHVERLITQ